MTLVGYGDVVPSTHFGRLISVFACLTGVVFLALLVSALSTTTDLTPTEDKVYEAITVDRAAREELREEAATVVKDFLLMTRLRKRHLESKRRTQLLMSLIIHAKRFQTKRLCVQWREEANDALLTRMEASID